MANSTYEVLEFRAVIARDITELYIRCSADSDGGVLVGGWYHKSVSVHVPAVDAIREALVTSSYLTEWDRGAPPLWGA